MPVGTYLHLHALGATNHVAVPGLARYGAKRGTGSYDARDQHMSGSHVRRVLENHNIRTPTLRSPARAVRYDFPRLNTQIHSPDKGASAVFAKCFLAK
jgi:hypothetical protein